MNDGFNDFKNIKNYDVGHVRGLRKRKSVQEREAKKEKKSFEFFDGAVSPRTFPRKNFDRISFIPESENRPAIVFPDGHIFLETFSPFFSVAHEFITAIAEPCSTPKYMHEYQISSCSLKNALKNGLTQDSIINVLSMISKTPLTEEFKSNIASCCRLTGNVKLVFKENRFFIESNNFSIIQELSSNEFIKTKIIAPRPTDRLYESTQFIVAKDDDAKRIIPEARNDTRKAKLFDLIDSDEEFEKIDEFLREKEHVFRFEVDKTFVFDIRKYAVDNNLFLSDEYDYSHDIELPDINAALKATTNIRQYQEDAKLSICSSGRARSGLIVLPCGAGKTLVGISAVAKIGKPAIICCNSVESVNEWVSQFMKWTEIDPGLVISLTQNRKVPIPDGPCVIVTTYGMLVSLNINEESQKIIAQINERSWGALIMDEIQEAPTNAFRSIVSIVKARTRIGLTATLIREDGKIEDLKYLVGPKLYEANWRELAEKYFLPNVKYCIVYSGMTADFYREYLTHQRNEVKKRVLVSANPNKVDALDALIQYHMDRRDKIYVFCDYVDVLVNLSSLFGFPAVYGDISSAKRTQILEQFRTSPEGAVVFISRICDKTNDLPAANVLIQVSSHYGSRLQELQRLGRILKPKEGLEEHNSFFYSLVSNDTIDNYFSTKRQQFLIEQGYSCELVTNPLERWPPYDDLKLSSKEAKKEWFETITNIKEISTDEGLTEAVNESAFFPSVTHPTQYNSYKSLVK